MLYDLDAHSGGNWEEKISDAENTHKNQFVDWLNNSGASAPADLESQ